MTLWYTSDEVLIPIQLDAPKRRAWLWGRVGLVTWGVLVTGCAAVQPHEPVFSSSPYNAADWAVVKSRSATFLQPLGDVAVVLLKTKRPTQTRTTEVPTHGVNLFVLKENGDLVYKFASLFPLYDDTGGNSYVDNVLDLRDVTGDGTPEIIFHSCSWGVSDFTEFVHVLQYHPGEKGQFRDISVDAFAEMRWQRLRWITFEGSTLALIADPIESTEPGMGCRACPKFHQYLVYRWNNAEERFVRVTTIPHTDELHQEDADYIAQDLPHILEALKGHPR